MTTWATGDTITSTWMNSVEQVLALGTFGATTAPRVTMTPSSSYTLAANQVAANVVINGTATVSGAGKQYEGWSYRTLTSTTTGAAAYATCISTLHTASPSSSAYAYNYIGSLTCGNAAAAGNKLSGLYQRVATGATANGATFVAGTFSVTHDTGSTVDGTSCMLNLTCDGTSASAFPIGIYLYTNNAGKVLNNVMVVDTSLLIGASCFSWNQNASQATGYFQTMYNSASALLYAVDYLGNVIFDTTAHSIKTHTTAVITLPTNTDIILGKAGSAAADTTGHIYIQAHATAPDGVPAGQAGYVPIRYCTTDKKIYVYDGGWIKTAALS